ncbi:phosphoribosylaminoimidazolesuccinocarboxamide synthase [Quadrisphaera sp. GCM10027208]|uniref:phosphoribosylaminoimidazolesuccinocarboxamide synthase n=1 Tax=Quadrisphaera sp. GCM10027208 TaxID=3273423 RepID=UPI003619CE22
MTPATAPPALPGWRHLYSGKVRDLYVDESDDSRVLVVASDRISAYDHVLATPIPDKGSILTALTLWWLERLDVPNHLLSTDVPAAVAGRAMVCRRLEMVPVECVARGYLTGSGLADYRATGAVCGVELPPGLDDGSRLEAPIFTPATKAALGEHDENVTFAVVASQVGAELAERLRRLTLDVYATAEALARDRGVIVADTKLEFGFDPDGVLTLGDEVLTPDSSRFWPADQWRPGRAQPSFDKQYVRDWLTSPASGWDRASDVPPPPLPDDVVERTRARYVEAYERITGRRWR